jgi:L-threonylcarbamoyladenylate synthase
MHSLNSIIQALKKGEIAIIPTDTVYGLAADASNLDAVQKLYVAKKRPQDLAIPVFIKDNKCLTEWAIEIPAAAYKLTDTFWPGALTIILRKAEHVSDAITSGKPTIALRSPDHRVVQELLTSFPHGLAVTSANISGQPAPATAEEAKQQLGNVVDAIFDDGPCSIGVASTIVDCSDALFNILRPGSISQDDIELVLY